MALSSIINTHFNRSGPVITTGNNVLEQAYGVANALTIHRIFQKAMSLEKEESDTIFGLMEISLDDGELYVE